MVIFRLRVWMLQSWLLKYHLNRCIKRAAVAFDMQLQWIEHESCRFSCVILWSNITAKQGLLDQLGTHTPSCVLFLFVTTLPLLSPDMSDPSRLLVSGVQAELEELVKKEHARIDSQDKSSQSKGAAAEQSAASAATEPKEEE